jgi:hypothetical protein
MARAPTRVAVGARYLPVDYGALDNHLTLKP